MSLNALSSFRRESLILFWAFFTFIRWSIEIVWLLTADTFTSVIVASIFSAGFLLFERLCLVYILRPEVFGLGVFIIGIIFIDTSLSLHRINFFFFFTLNATLRLNIEIFWQVTFNALSISKVGSLFGAGLHHIHWFNWIKPTYWFFIVWNCQVIPVCIVLINARSNFNWKCFVFFTALAFFGCLIEIVGQLAFDAFIPVEVRCFGRTRPFPFHWLRSWHFFRPVIVRWQVVPVGIELVNTGSSFHGES